MPRKYLWPIAVTIAALAAVALIVFLFPLTGAASRKAAGPTPASTRAQAAPPPGFENFSLAPDEVQPLTPEEARIANAAIATSTLPIQAARPFIAPIADVESYGRALDCLTAAIYYEAGFESPQGQGAVAQVVLNRMRHPAYPKTVCGVVFQGSQRATGCQFTFTCDGALGRPPSQLGWLRARGVAGRALNGTVTSGVGMATHYHADFVVPYWAPRLVKIGQIGAHIFYRWPGGWGLPAAFTGVHAMPEPVEPQMAALSSFAAAADGLDLPSDLDMPELPPLDPTASLNTATSAPDIRPTSGAVPIRIEPTVVAVPPPVAPVAPRAPQSLPDPLASAPIAPARSRRLPTPQN